MEKKHKDLLISKRRFLVENLVMRDLFDHMVETRLLSDNDKEILEVNEVSSHFCMLFTVLVK